MVGTGVTAGTSYLWAASSADLTYIAAESNAASLSGWPVLYLVGVPENPGDWVISVDSSSYSESTLPAWTFQAGHAYTGNQLTPPP